eukprot:5888222-Amphidinium_carterae.1
MYDRGDRLKIETIPVQGCPSVATAKIARHSKPNNQRRKAARVPVEAKDWHLAWSNRMRNKHGWSSQQCLQ